MVDRSLVSAFLFCVRCRLFHQHKAHLIALLAPGGRTSLCRHAERGGKPDRICGVEHAPSVPVEHLRSCARREHLRDRLLWQSTSIGIGRQLGRRCARRSASSGSVFTHFPESRDIARAVWLVRNAMSDIGLAEKAGRGEIGRAGPDFDRIASAFQPHDKFVVRDLRLASAGR